MKIYFGSFWANGFSEMDSESGKVTRLFALDPPVDNRAEQEGRSYVDASTGEHLGRLTTSKRFCVERIPDPPDGPTRVLISNLGDSTLEVVDVDCGGNLTSLGKAQVGKAPKRVAFLP